MNWFLRALPSTVFAGMIALPAKAGVEGISGNLAVPSTVIVAES